MRSPRRARCRRGFALIDYIIGTLILSATLIAVTSLNTLKIRSQGMASRRQAANFAAADLLDRIRAAWEQDPKARAAAFKAAGESGEAWAPINIAAVSEDSPWKQRFEAIAVDVRRVGGLDVRRFIELRLSLRWREDAERTELWSTSTLIARQGGKGS